MALQLWDLDDMQRQLTAAVTLTLSSCTGGGTKAEFARGALAMAKALALMIGCPWTKVMADVQLAMTGSGPAGSATP